MISNELRDFVTTVVTNAFAQYQQAHNAPAPAKKTPARPRATRAQRARDEQTAGVLNAIHDIGNAKRTTGKVVCDTPALLVHVAFAGIALPLDAKRFTLSIGNKGWAFTPAGMTEVPVTPEQAATLRALVPATLKV